MPNRYLSRCNTLPLRRDRRRKGFSLIDAAWLYLIIRRGGAPLFECGIIAVFLFHCFDFTVYVSLFTFHCLRFTVYDFSLLAL
jgi:hypothetical protein